MTPLEDATENAPHVVLIGGGIMSATLGVLLKQLDPRFTIDVYERLDRLAAESSDGWNNAGTGHSAFCELNYTPQAADGSVDTSKAIHIAECFERTRQLWAFLVEAGALPEPSTFVRTVPHISFVWGLAQVDYLKRRYEALRGCQLFSDMEYTEDVEVLRRWMPLVMEGRATNEPMAATRMAVGTDVDFGALSRGLFAWLDRQPGVQVHLRHEVRDLAREAHAPWVVTVKDLENDVEREVAANFVFVGAGGGALPLLEASGIPEASGFGGFPVSGVWFRCLAPEIAERHHAKVYGLAEVGAPPMSVPHLDSRVIDGNKALLFGPFAGFSTRFLKHGSWLDLPRSIHLDNVLPMMSAGVKNLPLTRYLIEQVVESTHDKLDDLHAFYPRARAEDWELMVVGQRVQVIRKAPDGGGVLQFGTELVTAEDGTIAALLGASPGASTAVSILLELIERCFPNEMPAWEARLREMIPTYGVKLAENPGLAAETRERTGRALRLEPPREPIDAVRKWMVDHGEGEAENENVIVQGGRVAVQAEGAAWIFTVRNGEITEVVKYRK